MQNNIDLKYVHELDLRKNIHHDRYDRKTNSIFLRLVN